MILADHVLLHGRILGPEPDAEALAGRRFNDHALADDRVTVAMLPIADGLTLAAGIEARRNPYKFVIRARPRLMSVTMTGWVPVPTRSISGYWKT